MDKNDKNNESRIYYTSGSNEPDKEFVYVQEKVKSKKGKWAKRFMMTTLIAFAAAIVFGVVARITFIYSQDIVEKLLGIEKEQPKEDSEENVDALPRKAVSFESTDKTNNQSQSDVVKSKNEPEKPIVTQKPTVTDSPKVTLEPKATEAPKATEEPLIIEPIITEEPQATQIPDQGETGEDDALDTEAGDGDETDDTEDGILLDPAAQADLLASLKQLLTEASQSIVKVKAINSGLNWLDENIETSTTHTGIVMAENGVELLIETAYAPMAEADRIEVVFGDSSVYKASIFNYDPDYNLAIIGIPINEIDENTFAGLKYAHLGNSGELSVGDIVIAVGKPNGYEDSIGIGLITCSARKAYLMDGVLEVYTTDLPYSELSDGMLVDTKGEMIGIITHTFENKGGAMLCTFVGCDSLKDASLKLLNDQKLGYTGIRAEDIPLDVLQGMGLENGIYVNEARSLTPSAIAGVRKGDIIVSVDEIPIHSVREYNDYVMNSKRNAKLKLKLYRSSNQADPYVYVTFRIAIK